MINSTNAYCPHGHPCRCYEEKLRRESKDAYDQDISVRTKAMLKRERTLSRFRRLTENRYHV